MENSATLLPKAFRECSVANLYLVFNHLQNQRIQKHKVYSMNVEKTCIKLTSTGKQKENCTVGLNTVYGRPLVRNKMITSYIHYYDNNVLKCIKIY